MREGGEREDSLQSDYQLERLESRQVLAVSVPRFDHIVVVMEENRSYSQIIGNSAAPFINKLAAHGAVFTRSFGLTHPSQPNYLASDAGRFIRDTYSPETERQSIIECWN